MSNETALDGLLAQIGKLEKTASDESVYVGKNWADDVLAISEAAFSGTTVLLGAVGALSVTPENIDMLDRLLSARASSLAEMIVEASARYGLSGDTEPSA